MKRMNHHLTKMKREVTMRRISHNHSSLNVTYISSTATKKRKRIIPIVEAESDTEEDFPQSPATQQTVNDEPPKKKKKSIIPVEIMDVE